MLCSKGIKNGFISAIGKAGNPDMMDHVTPGRLDVITCRIDT